MHTPYKPTNTIAPQCNIPLVNRMTQDAICDLIADIVFRYHRREEDGNILPLAVQNDWAELCNSVDPVVAELAAFDQDPEARQLVFAQVALRWQAMITHRGWNNSCASYNANLTSGLDQH
jgi:hypothetical protein